MVVGEDLRPEQAPGLGSLERPSPWGPLSRVPLAQQPVPGRSLVQGAVSWECCRRMDRAGLHDAPGVG